MSQSNAQERSLGPSFGRLGVDVRRWAFVVAIGLSAFLLFSLELRAGRLVLPVFGGAPAVWTTSLCFFTAVLFLGYIYAHFAATRISFRAAGAVQLGLVVAVVVIAVLAPTHLSSLRVSGMPAALNVLLVLAVVAGGPAFLLATTTPLLWPGTQAAATIRGGYSPSPMGPASSACWRTRCSSRRTSASRTSASYSSSASPSTPPALS